MILKKISLFSIVSLLTCSLSLFSPNLKWNTQVSGDAWNHFNLVEGHLNAKMLPLKINFKKYSFRNNTALPLHKNKILSVAANSFLGDSLWKTYDLVCKKKGSLFLKKKSWWENSDRKMHYDQRKTLTTGNNSLGLLQLESWEVFFVLLQMFKIPVSVKPKVLAVFLAEQLAQAAAPGLFNYHRMRATSHGCSSL